MTNVISRIERKLKRMAHRELSPEGLEKTKIGHRSKSRQNLLGFGTDVEYSTVDGEPQLRITERSLKTTQDFSHPGISHTLFYNDRTTQYRYTQDGRLVEKCVQTGNIYEGEGMRFTVVQYEPPGCWKGHKVEKTERSYGMFG
jgi:YD repeat-containing protein